MFGDAEAWVRDFAHDYALVTKLLVVLLMLGLAGVIVRVINRALRRTYWRRLAASQPDRVDELRHSQRQQTIVTLLESINRYVVYGAAIVVGLSIVTGGASSAIFGASLVVVVGFGLQRFLGDVVAGGLLLFEGQYAVGDFIEVNGARGVVEEFGLRTTALRMLNGDRVVVLNGSINTFTRFASGYRTFRIEAVVRNVEAAVPQVERVLDRNRLSPHQRFLVGPRVADVAQIPGDNDVARIEIEAAVPPTMESLCDPGLVAQLESALGDLLIAPVEAYSCSESALEAYRRSIIVAGDGS